MAALKLLYAVLAVLRVFSVIVVPQYGYIHPDEFHQGPEVMAGVVLGMDTVVPWEFQFTAADGPPIRSIVPPFLLAGVPMLIFKTLGLTDPYTLLVSPRIVCLVLSFLQEMALVSLCQTLHADPMPIVAVSALSHVVWVFHTHTFSNAIESALMTLAIWLVVQCRLKTQSKPPQSTLNADVLLGATIAVGIFTRFTFAIFTVPLAVAWIYINVDAYRNSGFTGPSALLRTTVLGITRVLLPFLAISASITAIDTAYYIGSLHLTEVAVSLNHHLQPPGAERGQHTISGYVFTTVAYYMRAWVLPSVILLGGCLERLGVGRVGASMDVVDVEELSGVYKWIVSTPYNGLSYNLDTTNLATHGVHSRLTHLVTNMPMLYGALTLTLLYVTLRALSVCALSVSVGGTEGSKAWQRLAVTVLPPTGQLVKGPRVIQRPGQTLRQTASATNTPTPTKQQGSGTRTRTRSRASQGRDSTSASHTHTDEATYTASTHKPHTIPEEESVLKHRVKGTRGDESGVDENTSMRRQNSRHGREEDGSVDDVLRGIGSLTLDTSQIWGKDNTEQIARSTQTQSGTPAYHTTTENDTTHRSARNGGRSRASGRSPALTLDRNEIGHTYDKPFVTGTEATHHPNSRDNAPPQRGPARAVHSFLLAFLLACVWVPLLVLSIQPHQEARFLLPLLTPMLLLTPTQYFKTTLAIPTLVVFNIVVGALYGYVHQAGVVPSLMYLRNDMHLAHEEIGCEDFTAVYYHTYMPARFLYLSTGDTPYTTTLEDLKGADLQVLNHRIQEWVAHTDTNIENRQGKVFERVRRDVHSHTPRGAPAHKAVTRNIIGDVSETSDDRRKAHTVPPTQLHTLTGHGERGGAKDNGDSIQGKEKVQEGANLNSRADGVEGDGATHLTAGNVKNHEPDNDSEIETAKIITTQLGDTLVLDDRPMETQVESLHEGDTKSAEIRLRIDESDLADASKVENNETIEGMDGDMPEEMGSRSDSLQARTIDTHTHATTTGSENKSADDGSHRDEVHEGYAQQHYGSGDSDGDSMGVTGEGPCRTLYVVLPTAVEDAISALQQYPGIDFKLQRDFFPHFSGEDIPIIDLSEVLGSTQLVQNALGLFSLRVYVATTGDCEFR